MAVATVVEHSREIAEERLVLHGVSWETYEQLMENFAERRLPHFAYDQGVLEIVSPSPEHDEDSIALGQLVAIVAEERRIDYRPVGSTTFRRQGLGKGFEADASFSITNQRFTRDLKPIDPTVDPPPDLVIEVDVSRSSLDKLPIYAAFGVAEVWRMRRDRVSILALDPAAYQEVPKSAVLPPLPGDVLTRFLVKSRSRRRLEWIRDVRAWMREQPA